MTVELMNINDYVQTTGIKAILHGPTGTGKTASIRTIPNQDKILVICIEKGLLTIKDVCKTVKVAGIKSAADLREVYENLNGGKWATMFETIVIDSLTEVSEVCLNSEKKATKDPRQAYGTTRDTVLEIVRAFKDLPFNIIFICHQGKIQDDTGKIFFGADFPGKQLIKDLPYQVDAVIATKVQLTDNGLAYLFQCRTDGLTDAKVRDPYMSIETFEPANWSVIYNKLKGVSING